MKAHLKVGHYNGHQVGCVKPPLHEKVQEFSQEYCATVQELNHYPQPLAYNSFVDLI